MLLQHAQFFVLLNYLHLSLHHNVHVATSLAFHCDRFTFGWQADTDAGGIKPDSCVYKSGSVKCAHSYTHVCADQI